MTSSQFSRTLIWSSIFQGVTPHEYGSRAHRQLMLDMAIGVDVAKNKLELAKKGRWYQATNKFREIQPQIGYIFMGLLYKGIHEKWYKSADELIVHASTEAALRSAPDIPPDGDEGAESDEGGDLPQRAAVGGAERQPPAGRVPLQHSNKDVERIREK